MKKIIILFILISAVGYSQKEFEGDALPGIFQTRYYYSGYFDKEKGEWYFSQPKSLLRLKKGDNHITRFLFVEDESVYVVTFDDNGRIIRVLKLDHWIVRSDKYQKPLAVYMVDHYNRLGERDKVAYYHHNVGWQYITKIEYYKKNQLIKEEHYNKGQLQSKKEYNE